MAYETQIIRVEPDNSKGDTWRVIVGTSGEEIGNWIILWRDETHAQANVSAEALAGIAWRAGGSVSFETRDAAGQISMGLDWEASHGFTE